MDDCDETFQLGDARGTVISEGTGFWPMELALDLPEHVWRPFVATDGRNRMPMGFNLALVCLGSTVGGRGTVKPTVRPPVFRPRSLPAPRSSAARLGDVV